ncbi:MAG: zinc-binding alcohol dehydrogenase [Roseibium sp.]
MAEVADKTCAHTGRALWYTREQSCCVEDVVVPYPASDEVLVRTLYSSISRGTEGLVFRGDVPETEWQRMRAPFQDGCFPFPVKYGYASVGEVLEGVPDLVGRLVFSLYPHQSIYTVPSQSCVPVPNSVTAERAALSANMETALNALWDGKPSPGDQISVVGGGVVGLLTAYLCQKLPGSTVTLIDTNQERAQIAADFGLSFSLPEDAPRDQDLVFHTSASSAGLATALTCAGDGASIIEMSWYGVEDVQVPLGADFHSRRLKLISSQVGTIPVERQARWNYRRRLETAMTLLQDPILDKLITHQFPLESASERLPEILNKRSDVLAALIVYDQNER